MAEPISVLYLNSANAASKSLANGQATFTVDPVIFIPQGKIKLSMVQFSFTNFFINISAALANNIFYYTDDIAVPNKYQCSIPTGSYNVSDLSNAINAEVINNGHADSLIQLVPDFATNKVMFSISAAGWQITFPAGSPYVLLGTTLNQTIPNGALTIGPYTELAPNVAQFNSILNLYLHTSLTNESVYSGRKSDIVASIIPTASIGSIQMTEPRNLIWVPCPSLSGATINTITIYVSDQNGNRINLSDDFSCTLLLAAM
jgi:hypothetical protein